MWERVFFLTRPFLLFLFQDPIILKNMNEGWAANSPTSNLHFIGSSSFHPSALPSPHLVSPLTDPLGNTAGYQPVGQGNNGFDSFCSSAVPGTPLSVVDPFTPLSQQPAVGDSSIQFYPDHREPSSSARLMRGIPANNMADLNFLSPDSVLCSPQEHGSLAGSLGELPPSARGIDPLMSLAQNPSAAIHDSSQMMMGSHSSISEMLSVGYTPTPATPTTHSMMVNPGSQTTGLMPGPVGAPTPDHVLPHDLSSIHPLDINASAINMEKYLHSPETSNGDKDSIAAERNGGQSQFASEILRDAPLSADLGAPSTKRPKRLPSRQSSPSKLVARPPIPLSTTDNEDRVMINMEQNSTHLGTPSSLPNDLSFLDSQGNAIEADSSMPVGNSLDRPRKLCLGPHPTNSSSSALTSNNLPVLSQTSVDGGRDVPRGAVDEHSDDIVSHTQPHTLLSASGNASDSSSGISSARTKLSSSLSPSPPPKSSPLPSPARPSHSLPCFSPEVPLAPGTGVATLL